MAKLLHPLTLMPAQTNGLARHKKSQTHRTTGSSEITSRGSKSSFSISDYRHCVDSRWLPHGAPASSVIYMHLVRRMIRDTYPAGVMNRVDTSCNLPNNSIDLGASIRLACWIPVLLFAAHGILCTVLTSERLDNH